MYWSRPSFLATLNVLALAKAQSLTDVLAGNDDLSILSALVKKLDLASSLNGTNTILAPVNSAFTGVNTGDATATTVVNGVPLSDLLQYHIIDEVALMSSDIKNGSGTILPTLLTASAYDGLTNAAQMVNPVRNGTVLHVYSGARNASTITGSDITYDGGIIHTIDHLLAVPENATGVAKQNSSLSLSNFASALGTANITSLVDTMHNLTIFAPTTAAFSLANINTPLVDPTRLKDIMSYHVVSHGEVLYSSDLMAFANNTNLTTLEGTDLVISFNGSHIKVNNATVTTSNVLIKNGVVHIINQLLNPESVKGFVGGFKPTPSAATALATPTFVMAMALIAAAFLM